MQYSTRQYITYRIFEENDIGGVLDLWKHHSGWGEITKDQFVKWHLNTPNGPCLIIIATNETEQIIGQSVLIPSIIQIKDKKVKAVRLSAPILHKDLRQPGISNKIHPVFSIIKFAIETATNHGYQILYCYPSLGWIALMKSLNKVKLTNFNIATYDCFCISLKDPATFFPVDDELQVSVLKNGFNQEHTELWNDAVNEFPISCGIIRNSAWLNWKSGGHLVLEIRNTGNDQLKGYVCLRKKDGLIEDMLARNKKDTAIIIKMVIHSMHQLNSQTIALPFEEITGMYTPLFQSLLNNIPFEFKDFEFAFGVNSLNNSICDEDTKPSNWYMMPND